MYENYTCHLTHITLSSISCDIEPLNLEAQIVPQLQIYYNRKYQ